MKIIKVFTTVILVSVIVFSGCKKDKEDNKKNAFTIGETEYELDNGAVEYYGITVEGGDYNFDVYIYSSDIDYYSETGTGEVVYFELFSETFENIKSGVYEFDADRTGKKGTFGPGIKSILFTDYNLLTEQGTRYTVTDGTLTISASGDTYTFDFNLELADGNSVEGHFKGQLLQIDFQE